MKLASLESGADAVKRAQTNVVAARLNDVVHETLDYFARFKSVESDSQRAS
jgi:hypothetical protein